MEANGGKRGRTNGGSGTSTAERKEVERERRQHMKELCAKLVSSIPKEHCSSTEVNYMSRLCASLDAEARAKIPISKKDTLTLLGSLDGATTYIKKLKDRVDELHQRRSSAQAHARLRGGASSGVSTQMSGGMGSELEGEKVEKALAAPVVEVQHHDDSSMEVMLICSIERPIKLHEVITILEEEGAEIVNVNHSMTGHKIFYTIHSRAFNSRIGIEVSRVPERLRALV